MPARRSPASSAAAPARSCSPAAAPRPTTRRSSVRSPRGGTRGVLGRRAPRRAPRRRAGARARSSASTRPDGSTSIALADALDDDVAIVSVMAVNNEVGSVTDLAAVAEVVRRRRAARAAPHRCRAGRDVARPPHRDAARRPALAVGAQVRRSEGRRRARRPRRRRAAAAADRRRSGARAAQRHAERRRRRRDGGGAARRRRRARGRGRPPRRAARPAGRPARRRARRRARDGAARATRSPARHTCASAASRTRRCCSCSTRPASARALRRRAAAGAMEPSHVLAAMGVEREWAQGALRLSLGRTTSAADVERAADVIVDAVRRIRAHAVDAAGTRPRAVRALR